MAQKIKTIFIFKCQWCGKIENKRATKHNLRQRFCSSSCSAKWRMSQLEIKAKIYTTERNQKLSTAIKKHYRDHPEFRTMQAKRMREYNPMQDNKTRIKMQNTMRKAHSLGTKTARGGNGRDMTKYEALIHGCFPALIWNHVQRLGPKIVGYPTHYKIDLACPVLKIAIEIDGNSHFSRQRQAQDYKKTVKLQEFGWEVIRIKHKQLEDDFEGVILWLEKLFQERLPK